MIKVAGGTYLEYCAEPYWHEVYGSGLRAATGLSKLTQVEFYTYAAQGEVAHLSISEKSYGIRCFPKSRETQISFSYQHPLAVPSLSPPIGTFAHLPQLKLSGEVVLRFGMLEGDALVEADRVVYDPQSAFDPQLYHGNGSTARHLAIVLNKAEAARLANSHDLSEIGQKLLNDHSAEVVVVKQGPWGCAVITANGIDRVPAFRTSRVWPIGSGDIFAAAFAYHWGERRESPLEAARLASMSTSLYCESRTLPLPVDIGARFEQVPIEPVQDKLDSALVYLAAPFFNVAERWLVTQARNALRDQRVRVFSPFHDVGIGVAGEVVPKDIDALNKCTVVLALLDHFDPGTVFEVGWARKRKVPVIIFTADEGSEALKMFDGTNCDILTDFSTAVYRTVWSAISK